MQAPENAIAQDGSSVGSPPNPATVFLNNFPRFSKGREDDDSLDLSTDDLHLTTATDAMQASIEAALTAWNDISPLEAVQALRPKEQRESTLAFARVGYSDAPAATDDETRIKDVFRGLKSEAQYRAEHMPSAATQAFLEKYPPQRQRPLEAFTTPSWLVANHACTTNPPLSEVLYLFEVLHPTQNPRKNQFVLALASQTLVELVDAIYCVSHLHLKEYDSGCKLCYLDSVFMDPIPPEGSGSTHYAGEIAYWMDTLPMLRLHDEFPGFREPPRPMLTTRLADLNLRFDVPYLFLHLGSCEHVMYFRNMRLLHDRDEVDTAKYPLRVHASTRQHQKCLICHNHAAKHVTFDDPMAVEDPMFYCESCYFMAHYDANGRLLDASFRVYPYYPDD
ncbi:hypothetical protein SDRG_12887 [Saprolegnia diclina VS20]|uniref:snRNA-activating protein complex subunit 3 n=1 Tax=Saprolegnia diclina (strain VS20) TaxID=1156394 RepID=T0PV99_SAPDV|nr:hypothetical protein SDRG_12887 [Saprolegnia diclina VS20]EQC29424.1 hypothetical protein SDRG_12887 [Saprolegnia diclina VS20]|eukprot:XP_008617191.1 hypothetical protein SDRG_12887 [Saprolegnia diclina VS20]